MENNMNENEEHKEEEIDSKQEEVAKKYLGKFDALMAEMSVEMLDDETRDKVTEKFKKVLSSRGLAFNLSHLKAMYEGIRLAMTAQNIGDLQLMTTMLFVMSRLIADKEKVVKDIADKAMEGSEKK